MKALTFTLLFIVLCSAAFATQNKKTLTLRLTSPNGNSGVTTIYFDDGVTPSYDIHEDAAFVFNNIPGIPQIYSYTLDKVACSINGAGTLQNTEVVNLGYQVGDSAVYTLDAGFDNFNPTSIIRLVDNKLGDTTDLLANFVQVELDSNDISTNRFEILVSSAVGYSSQASDCSNSGGSITIYPDTTITWTQCELMDSATQQIIQTYYNIDGPLSFTGLAEGNYEVLYMYNDYTANNYFYLSGNYVIASIGVPSQQIYTNEGVIFSALTTNAEYFNWDFGDSTLIVGVSHPTQTYLVPGTYTVNLYASNTFGCAATAQATVTVLMQENTTGINGPATKDVTVTAFDKVINVNMNGATLSGNAVVEVYNLIGQSVKLVPLNLQTINISLGNQASGYYLVAIRNAGTVNTKRVFIAK